VDPQSFAEQLFFVTARLEGTDGDRHWVGTGFLCQVPLANGTDALYLVSNKHVLEDAQELTATMVGADGELPALGHGVSITISGARQAVVGHPDPSVDVALLPFATALEHLAQTQKAFIKTLPTDLFMTAEQADQLDAIEDVLFVGYPSGLFDSKNLTPIARRGTTATPVALDYEGEPAFLIDATVFPGSSGSPVFIADRGSFSPKSGGLVAGSRTILIGVLAAVHMAQVEGEVDELPASHTIAVDTPLGLGIVYKAAAIEQCLDLALQGQPARRAL